MDNDDATRNLAEVIRDAARANPDRAALIGAWGQRTWAQLDAAVDAGAQRLASVAPGARVVLALPTGPELAAALFAALRAGLVAVPLDPEHPDIAEVVQRVGADLAITDAPLAISVIASAEIAGWWTGPRCPAGAPRAAGEDLAILARAGRSGPPVMLAHRALACAGRAVAGAEPMDLKPADRVLQILPLFHVVGLVTAFLPAAMAGAAVVIPNLADAATRVVDALAAVREHRVSVLPAEPTLYRQLERVDGFERALASVRLMTSGSSPLDAADFATIRSATGQAVREGYGISEAASAVTSTLMARAARPGSAGLPYPGVELRIVNHLTDLAAADPAPGADTAAPAGEEADAEGRVAAAVEALVDGVNDLVDTADPDGGLGPIAIRGTTLFSGYWPDGAGGPGPDGWFVTGDIGYLDDSGELHLVDRASETLTVDGFRVYPREIEDVIAGHPHVADVAVVGVPGRGGDAVIAVIVPQPGTRPNPEDLSDYAAGILPPFKRPADYSMVPVLPRTEVGRLDRTAVRAQYAAAHGIDLPASGLRAAAGSKTDQRAGAGRTPPTVADRSRSGQDTDEDLF